MRTVSEHLGNLIEIPSVSSMSNRGVIEYATATLLDSAWHVGEVTYRDADGVEKINLVAAPKDQNLEDRDIELAQSISEPPFLEEAIRSIVVPFRFAHGVLAESSHRDTSDSH